MVEEHSSPHIPILAHGNEKRGSRSKHLPFKNLLGKLHTFLLTLPQWSELGCIHPKLGRSLECIVPTMRILSTPMVLTTSGMFSVPTTSSLILLTLTGCSTIRFDPDSNYLKLTQTQNLRAPSHKTVRPIALEKHHKSWASCTSGQLVVNWEFPHPLLRFDNLVKELKELGNTFYFYILIYYKGRYKGHRYRGTQGEVWQVPSARDFVLWSWGVPPSRHMDAVFNSDPLQTPSFREFCDHIRRWGPLVGDEVMSWGWSSYKWDQCPYKSSSKELPPLSAMWGLREKIAFFELGRGPSPKTKFVSALILDFSVSRTMRNTFLKMGFFGCIV